MIGELEGKPAAGGLEMEDRGQVSSDPGGRTDTWRTCSSHGTNESFLAQGDLGDWKPRKTIKSHHTTNFTQEIYWAKTQNGTFLCVGTEKAVDWVEGRASGGSLEHAQ